MPSFNDFDLDPSILKALEKMQYKDPSPIQSAAIPLIQQKKDVIVLAQTGSGKTAACAIPICNQIDHNSLNIQALILVPTRELALQYATETQKIGQEKRVKTFALFGGSSSDLQLSKLKHGVQVLVATPGRLIDFIYQRVINLTHVQTLILDEADEMLSMGFYDDLEFIMNCLNHPHQTLLFSATMPPIIRDIAKKHLKDPLEISLVSDEVSPTSIEHRFAFSPHHSRDATLIDCIKQLNPHQAIIFCHTRFQCEKVCRTLQKNFDGVDFLHAGLVQDVRSIITNKFRSGKIRFLVATDVAARGLDFSGVSHVFIYQLSDDPDIYVHRSGRTGRQDRVGMVITIVIDREIPILKRILHKINKEPIWMGEPPPPDADKKTRYVRPRGRRPGPKTR